VPLFASIVPGPSLVGRATSPSSSTARPPATTDQQCPSDSTEASAHVGITYALLVPAFEISAPFSSQLDWGLFQTGFVHLYWKPEVLGATSGWFERQGYEVTALDAARWRSEGDMHDDLAAALSFPDYYGRNLDALNDCFSDVAAYSYGASADSAGTVLVIRRFDALMELDRRTAVLVASIFARQAAIGALLGHRMILLLQSNDPDLRLALPEEQVSWNPAEWLPHKRHPRT
jgi:hypothetical protein